MIDRLTPLLPLLIVAGYFAFLVMCYMKSVKWLTVNPPVKADEAS